MQRTLEQNTKLHALIGQLHLDADIKADLVQQFSGGRCTSSRDLSQRECARLISYLDGLMANESKRKEAVRMKMVWRLYYTIRDLGYFPMQTNKEAMESLERMSQKIWNKSVKEMTVKDLSASIGIVHNWKPKKTCQES